MRSTRSRSWSRRLLGFDPTPVPGHVFSVDGRRVRYGRFTRAGSELTLDEFYEEELGDGAFVKGPLGGPIRDADRFNHSLSSLLSRLSDVPDAASLVLPDQWLRVAFSDLEQLPRGADMEEVLRFKLKRLVPFRVEDLRVSAEQVPSLESGQSRQKRLILGFAIETLLAEIEGSFERRGVIVGHLSCESLSVLPGLSGLLGGCLGVVAHVTEVSYSLVLTLDGQPVLHRFKPLAADQDSRVRLVPRDLGLTASFVRQELKGRRLAEIVLVAAPAHVSIWKEWLETAFEYSVRPIDEDLPELPGDVPGVPTWDALPLLGAASRGVS